MGVGAGEAGSGDDAGLAVEEGAGVALGDTADGVAAGLAGVCDTVRTGEAGEAEGVVAVAAGPGLPLHVRAARPAIAATPVRTARR
ncbi:MAG: hypothetical protein HYY34_07150 [Chloroflexi bacterium]|nr:hypothetical protein [Chloroflexota bacterium]